MCWAGWRGRGEHLHGYRPWLRDVRRRGEHTGASFRAALGARGRAHAARETPKAVYLYELDRVWRRRLAAPPPAALVPGEGLDAASWAANEFGGAPLGDAPERAPGRKRAAYGTVSDARHHRRHERSARLGQGTLPVDQPADGEVTVANILNTRGVAAPAESTVRSGHHPNFARRGRTQGPIGCGARPASARDPGRGDAAGCAPPEARARKPREARKSFRWIEGLRDCAEAARELPDRPGPRGRLPGPVRRTARAHPGSSCWCAPRSTGPGAGYRRRRQPGLAAPVRDDAQRPGRRPSRSRDKARAPRPASRPQSPSAPPARPR